MADAKLIIRPPHMQVRLKPGAWVDISRMHQTIRDAGYQPIPDRVELRVAGRLRTEGDSLVLELSGMQAPVRLLLVPAKDKPDVKARLTTSGEQEVELEGAWQPAPEGKGPGSLTVTAVRTPGGAKD